MSPFTVSAVNVHDSVQPPPSPQWTLCLVTNNNCAVRKPARELSDPGLCSVDKQLEIGRVEEQYKQKTNMLLRSCSFLMS